MEERETLGAFLKSARGTRSQNDVTRAGGPASGNLAQYERDQRFPSIETLHWLCNFYQADIKKAAALLEQERTIRDLKRVGVAA